MAGHSQFANIKHRKDVQDSKRAKIFIKISKEINVAVKKGGPNIESNPSLRLVLEKARANNMPKDNYEKVIKKAAGETTTDNYEEVRYEGYGPNGVAVIVECLTDNRNRTAANVRSYFTKKGGSLGQTNSVAYLFECKGIIAFSNDQLCEDEVLEWLLETKAEDLQVENNNFIIITAPDKLMQVKKFLTEVKKINDFDVVEITMNPTQFVEVDSSTKEKVEGLINLLEEDDDVQQVYHNAQWD